AASLQPVGLAQGAACDANERLYLSSGVHAALLGVEERRADRRRHGLVTLAAAEAAVGFGGVLGGVSLHRAPAACQDDAAVVRARRGVVDLVGPHRPTKLAGFVLGGHR